MNQEQPLTIPDVIGAVFTNFVGFARDHFDAPRPPAMWIVAWLIGMDAVAGAIELDRMQTGSYIVSNWFHAWLRIMIGGMPVGVLRYWIVGTLFHALVMLAGGKGPARSSRYVVLYALVPAAVVNVSVKIVEMLVHGNNYFTAEAAGAMTMVTTMVMFAAYVYTVRLCYLGMIHVLDTNRRRTIAVLVSVAAGMIFVTGLLAIAGGA